MSHILLTAANTALGHAVTGRLQLSHKAIYAPRDLRKPAPLLPLMEGAEAILHVANYPEPVGDETDILDHAARGTYTLLRCARDAGVQRVVYASRLSLLAGYPQNAAVDMNWRPIPASTAAALTPYVGELVCREFARSGGPRVTCVRLPDPDRVNVEQAAEALVTALDELLGRPEGERGYSWRVVHCPAEQGD